MSKDPTIPSPGDAIPSWLNDLGRLYFSKEDGDQVKAKINGLSVGIDHLKLAVGLLATGATAVKADFTGIKIDEKGITVLGRQKVTWPHARDDKAKADSAEKLITKRIGQFDKKLGELGTLRRANAMSGGDKYLEKQIRKVSGKLQKFQRDIDKQQKELQRIEASDSSKKAGHKKFREDESGQITKIEREVKRLSTALAGGS